MNRSTKEARQCISHVSVVDEINFLYRDEASNLHRPVDILFGMGATTAGCIHETNSSE